MTLRRRWDINTRTQLITLGPALLLTLLLISFFTFVRIQDLRQELDHTGQLIANQLAPATEYGVISGNIDVLDSLLRATLATPHVRFLEIQDSAEKILLYVEQPSEKHDRSLSVKVFQAPIRLQHIQLGNDFFQDNLNEPKAPRADYLGRVIVGMSNDAFSQRQQEILFKAGILALFALLFTFLLARRLAASLSQPISAMGHAVKAIQQGDYKTPLPIVDDSELGDLSRHINNLGDGGTRLLDVFEVELGQGVDRVLGLIDVPAAVRINPDASFCAEHCPHLSNPGNVIGQGLPDIGHLHLGRAAAGEAREHLGHLAWTDGRHCRIHQNAIPQWCRGSVPAEIDRSPQPGGGLRVVVFDERGELRPAVRPLEHECFTGVDSAKACDQGQRDHLRRFDELCQCGKHGSSLAQFCREYSVVTSVDEVTLQLGHVHQPECSLLQLADALFGDTLDRRDLVERERIFAGQAEPGIQDSMLALRQ